MHHHAKKQSSASGSPLDSLYGEKGALTGVGSLVSDISEKKRLEESVQMAREEYRLLLERNPNPLFILEQKKLGIFYVNRAAIEKYGYSREEFLAMTALDLLVEADRSRYMESISQCVFQEQLATPRSEWSHRKKDGTFFQIEGTWSRLNFMGKPATLLQAVDITHRKTECLLRESEDRLRIAVEAGKVGTWDYCPVTGKLKWSERLKRMRGVPLDAEVNYGTFLSTIHPADKDRVEQTIKAAMQPTSSGEYDMEFRTIRLDDRKERWSSVKGKVYFDNEKKPCRFIGTTIDITDKRNAEENLKRLTEELRHSNVELEQFVNIVVHDLSEPLRTIAQFLTLLRMRYAEKLDGDAKQFITYAVDGSLRLKKLIDSLRDFSLVGNKPVCFSDVNCNEVLDDVVRSLSTVIIESGARLNISRLPKIQGDAALVGELFQNLISNAIKYRGVKPPLVDIYCEMKNAQWRICVRDNGIGIDMDHSEDIFRIFRRLHRNEEIAGTGLGLAVCKKIVEMHGGDITVESVVGQGSVFSFTLGQKNEKTFHLVAVPFGD